MKLSVLCSLVASAAALPQLEIKGNKFFYPNNTQFLMRGVAYQQAPSGTADPNAYADPLANAEACKRDLPYLQELHTNVVRVYSIDPTKDHTACMKLLDAAGIYVLADLAEPAVSINREGPQWDLDLLKRYTDVVDALQKYPNTLGFFAGNEVTNSVANTQASAYVKAAIRDTKAYIKKRNYRSLPVGYAANDDEAIRRQVGEYFACGSDQDRADFFGLNIYEWCGNSTYERSGYAEVTRLYKNMGIPLFFSEYGCNAVRPRVFQEVSSIYTKMTDVWSGGIVFMYFQEQNNYGLVEVKGSSVKKTPDFAFLKSELGRVSPVLHSASAATPTSCPTVGNNWRASTSLPPTPDQDLCDCVVDSLECALSPSADSSRFGGIFQFVCQAINCSAIAGDAQTGIYGNYSGCAARQKLSYVMDAYYKFANRSDSACDFQGAGVKQTPKNGTCATKLPGNSSTPAGSKPGSPSAKIGNSSALKTGDSSALKTGDSSALKSGNSSTLKAGNSSGSNAGAKTGAMSEGKNGAKTGAMSEGKNGAKTGATSDKKTGTNAESNAGGISASKPEGSAGSASGSNSGNRSGSNGQSSTGSNSGSNAGSNSGHKSGTTSGSSSGNKSGSNSGSGSGKESGSGESNAGNKSGSNSGSGSGKESGSGESNAGNKSGSNSGSGSGKESGSGESNAENKFGSNAASGRSRGSHSEIESYLETLSESYNESFNESYNESNSEKYEESFAEINAESSEAQQSSQGRHDRSAGSSNKGYHNSTAGAEANANANANANATMGNFSESAIPITDEICETEVGANNTQATDSANSIQSTEGSNKAENTKSTDGANKAENTQSTDGANKAENTQSTDGANKADNTKSTKGPNKADNTQSTDGSNKADNTQSTDGSNKADNTQSTDGSNKADNDKDNSTQDICKCLEASLECEFNPNGNMAEIENTQRWACEQFVCKEIKEDGKYFSCSAEQKLGYAMNLYYTSMSRQPHECEFGGLGRIKKPTNNGQCGTGSGPAEAAGKQVLSKRSVEVALNALNKTNSSSNKLPSLDSSCTRVSQSFLTVVGVSALLCLWL